MEIIFIMISGLTLASAIAALSLRNLVQCALCLALTFAGLAGMFLQLNAEFAGFVQLLVYIGAVAILIVFTILLTRGAMDKALSKNGSGFLGICVALLVFGSLVFPILNSSATIRQLPQDPGLTVKRIGEELMTHYVLPLEIIGLLLTAAMIGAVIIALHQKETGAGQK